MRRQFENDHYTPNPLAPEPYRQPASILGDIELTPAGLAQARQDWAAVGYHGE